MTDRELAGLRAEVVDEDCYGLLALPAPPAVVVDVGANVGVFALRVRELFPDARVVCVEPDARNLDRLYAAVGSWATVYPAALGRGPVYRMGGAENGAHESYVTEGPGFPLALLGRASRVVSWPSAQGRPCEGYAPCSVESIALSDLLRPILFPPHRAPVAGPVLVKIDAEGGENSLYADDGEWGCLAGCDYVAVEQHRFCLPGAGADALGDLFNLRHGQLARTHDVVYAGQVVRAVRRAGAP